MIAINEKIFRGIVLHKYIPFSKHYSQKGMQICFCYFPSVLNQHFQYTLSFEIDIPDFLDYFIQPDKYKKGMRLLRFLQNQNHRLESIELIKLYRTD